MKLAEALVLRKHIAKKIEQLAPIKEYGDRGLLEKRQQRVKVAEEIDEVTISVPHVSLKEITAEHDLYSKSLRQLDTAIQQTNWTAELQGFELDKGISI